MPWFAKMEAGRSWARDLTVSIDDEPMDLTGYVVTARIGTLELTAGAGINLGDAGIGVIGLSLSKAQTTALGAGRHQIIVDAESSGGEPLRRIYGTAVSR